MGHEVAERLQRLAEVLEPAPARLRGARRRRDLERLPQRQQAGGGQERQLHEARADGQAQHARGPRPAAEALQPPGLRAAQLEFAQHARLERCGRLAQRLPAQHRADELLELLLVRGGLPWLVHSGLQLLGRDAVPCEDAGERRARAMDVGLDLGERDVSLCAICS